jgi:hypothetical protein
MLAPLPKTIPKVKKSPVYKMGKIKNFKVPFVCEVKPTCFHQASTATTAVRKMISVT